MDHDYLWYIKEKARVIAEEGRRALDSLPENDAGAAELLETVIDYLPKVSSHVIEPPCPDETMLRSLQRFPSMFEALPDGIRNKQTGENLEACSQLSGIPALKAVSRLTQCDFLMAREREDGHVCECLPALSLPHK